MSETDPSAPNSANTTEVAKPAPAWKPLSSRQRRVLGVLLEKAKTTPDAYPMTYSGLTTGCNQKSNREPQMNLTPEQVEDVVQELRQLNAVSVVQGSGRVDKIRHYAYQWFGISAPEAAIMTELLLRGDQTLGELRQRASRMDPIADLGTLHQLLDGLEKKNLIIYLTPAGRGQVVTHNVYRQEELDQLRTKYKSYVASSDSDDSPSSETPTERPVPRTSSSHSVNQPSIAALQSEIDSLKQLVGSFSDRLEKLERLIQ